MPVALRDVAAGYRRDDVLFGVSADIVEGEILGVFGHNGAGKTTLLRVLGGRLAPSSGTIASDWDRSNRMPRTAYVPQDQIVFAGMSVHSNLLIGAWDVRLSRSDLHRRIDEIVALFPVLAALMHHDAGSLSGGEKRMVALGRALLGHPELLLVDEPSVGLAPAVVDVVMDLLQQIRSGGTTVVLVEQNLPAALEIIDRFYVMRQGEIVANENAAEHRKRPITELFKLV